MKIHNVPMKDECCYLVAVVLLTRLLDDTNMVLLTCLDYDIGTIQIGSVTGDPPVTPWGTAGMMTDERSLTHIKLLVITVQTSTRDGALPSR